MPQTTAAYGTRTISKFLQTLHWEYVEGEERVVLRLGYAMLGRRLGAIGLLDVPWEFLLLP
jgi:hypothetical protein